MTCEGQCGENCCQKTGENCCGSEGHEPKMDEKYEVPKSYKALTVIVKILLALCTLGTLTFIAFLIYTNLPS